MDNPRLKAFLNVFFRLAQIDMLNEVEVYLVLKLKHIFEQQPIKNPKISIKELKTTVSDVDEAVIEQTLKTLAQLKYLRVVNHKIVFEKKLLKYLQND